MKVRLITMLFTVLMVFFSTGCNITTNKLGAKTKVATTIFPIYDAAKNIGGDKIDVVLILPAGASPHNYSFTPNDLKRVNGSKLVFYNGFGLDDWAIRFSKDIGAKTVNISSNLEDIYRKHDNNPHFWLSPELFVEQCSEIKDSLSLYDPQNSDFYEKNYENYTKEVLNYGETLKDEAKRIKNKNLITFHNAFIYFAEYFGFNIITSIEESPGEIPTPGKISEVEKAIKELKIPAVFKEPQQSTEIYKAIIEDTKVKVLTLDPLGDGKNITSYNQLIKYNIETIIYAYGVD